MQSSDLSSEDRIFLDIILQEQILSLLEIRKALKIYEQYQENGEKVSLKKIFSQNFLDENTVAYIREKVKRNDNLPPTKTEPIPELPHNELLLGRYTKKKHLGQGAMGEVFLVEDSAGETVALKLMLPQAIRGSSLNRDRFVREIEAMKRMSHPNIVRIFDAGVEEETPFFTMEYIEGRNLGELLASRRKMSSRRVAKIMEKVARAVHFAHTKNIIHRDLKPGNIMLANGGEPKVMDFGLARPLRDGAKLSQTGAVLGTPCYMAPEQARGQGQFIDERTDVYALGACLYEMLTLQTPFSGSDPMSILWKVVKEPVVPPTEIRSSTPKDLENICLKALSKDKTQRYASAEEMADDLERFCQGKKVSVRPPSLTRRIYAVMQRRPLFVALVSVVAVLAVMVPLLLMALRGPSWVSPGEREQNELSAEELQDRPLLWPESLWKECWDTRGWLDFTQVAWKELSYEKKVSYVREYQRWYARKMGKGVEKAVEVSGATLFMVLIPPGKFEMPPFEGKEPNEKFTVILDSPFWVGKTEVTQGQWTKIVGTQPWKKKRFHFAEKIRYQIPTQHEYPACYISWQSIQEDFLPKLQQEKSDPIFRLPTEAEWNYSCQAGIFDSFFWGETVVNSQVHPYANLSPSLKQAQLHKVSRRKKPNPFGLYDMIGNVNEWCYDWYASYPTGEYINPKGPASGATKVVTGLSFLNSLDKRVISWGNSSNIRDKDAPKNGRPQFGFRVLLKEN